MGNFVKLLIFVIHSRGYRVFDFDDDGDDIFLQSTYQAIFIHKPEKKFEFEFAEVIIIIIIILI